MNRFAIDQRGQGIPIVFRGPYQRGNGLGSIFRGLYRVAVPALRSIGRAAAPLVKSAGKAVAKQVVDTGMEVVRDVSKGEDFRQSLKRRGGEGFENIAEKTGKTIRDMVGSGSPAKKPRVTKKAQALAARMLHIRQRDANKRGARAKVQPSKRNKLRSPNLNLII
jgi:hypothetical protein